MVQPQLNPSWTDAVLPSESCEQREIKSKEKARDGRQHDNRAASMNGFWNHGMDNEGQDRAAGDRLTKDGYQ